LLNEPRLDESQCHELLMPVQYMCANIGNSSVRMIITLQVKIYKYTNWEFLKVPL
jgi:hypothetical protein